jgi:GT2 family glycosyltransferase
MVETTAPPPPLVHVVIVNWNGWRETVACLEALEGIDYPSARVVVVDNASTNDSVARIREAYPEVTVIESDRNRGFAGGNNLGIRHALEEGAEFVWLLNNDTKPDPRALTAMVDVALANPRAGAVGSVLYDMDPAERLQEYGGGTLNFLTGRCSVVKRPVPAARLDYLSAASMIVRREVFEAIGLLDERFFMYWEDIDFCLRLRRAGWTLALAPNARILHAKSRSIVDRSTRQDTYSSASAVLFWRRHSRFPLLPIAIGQGGRIVKRAVLGSWAGAGAIVRGCVAGLRHRAHVEVA